MWEVIGFIFSLTLSILVITCIVQFLFYLDTRIKFEIEARRKTNPLCEYLCEHDDFLDVCIILLFLMIFAPLIVIVVVTIFNTFFVPPDITNLTPLPPK